MNGVLCNVHVPSLTCTIKTDSHVVSV